jgi:hypothetical protein
MEDKKEKEDKGDILLGQRYKVLTNWAGTTMVGRRPSRQAPPSHIRDQQMLACAHNTPRPVC